MFSERQPRRPRTIDTDELLRLYAELGSGTLVAERMGCSTAYVCRIRKKAGYQKIEGTRNPHAKTNADKILDHIVSNGGTIKTARAALNLKVCDAVIYRQAKVRGINIRDYRYFGKTTGVLTVAEPKGFYRKDGTTYIPVSCSECGEVSDVSYATLYYLKHPKCPHCGKH